jgi:hypothetical protein
MSAIDVLGVCEEWTDPNGTLCGRPAIARFIRETTGGEVQQSYLVCDGHMRGILALQASGVN